MDYDIEAKWDEILHHMKDSYELSDAAFRTFIKKLNVNSVKGNTIDILIDDEKIPNSTSFIKNKYDTFLKVSIEEITGIQYELNYISKTDSKHVISEDIPVVIHHNNNPTLNSRYTFDNFVVGDNNDFAHAAALKVAESPGDIYNPLFIYGGAGLGKTHLMNAIANYIQDHDPTKKVMYVTSETFTNEIVDAVRDNKGENFMTKQEFRNKYRGVDVLLIDDIQFIIGKEATQNEFFHTFNDLYESSKQIVISSDKHPSTMTTLEERLRSRFEMGLTVDVKAPTYETRMAILRNKVSERGIIVDNEILDYIAKNIISNIRELQGAINKVISYSSLVDTDINMDIAKKALSDIINPNIKKEITIDFILEIVAEHFNVSVKEILSSSRSSNIVKPRHICMYLSRNLIGSTYEEIGNKIGQRNHTSVMHAEKEIRKKLESNDEETVNTIDILIKKINPK